MTMSANTFASDDGKLTIQVKNYETGEIVGLLEVSGLMPRHRLQMELLAGWNWEDLPKEPNPT